MGGREMNGVGLVAATATADRGTSRTTSTRAEETRELRPDAEKGVRVLLVDDDEDTLEVIALILRLCGYEVVVARSGPSALAVSTMYRPDVALLDLKMPGMDGFVLAARLTEAMGSAPPRLIAFTSCADEISIQRGRQVGFARYLVKPVNLPSLLEAIEGDEPSLGSGSPTPSSPTSC